MRLLLDTHVLIWWDSAAKLSSASLRAIRDADEVLVSAASAWEVAIKMSLGKLSTKRSVSLATHESGFVELATTFAHAEQVERLPALHRDPFDRMLVAQAIVEGCTIVTRDSMLARYGVAIITA